MNELIKELNNRIVEYRSDLEYWKIKVEDYKQRKNSHGEKISTQQVLMFRSRINELEHVISRICEVLDNE